jgi:hypothetical protein
MLWDHIKHFHAGEKWGPPAGMNGLLVMLLDKIRECWPEASFVIHCGLESDGHSKDSFHKTGNAVDFHIQKRGTAPDSSLNESTKESGAVPPFPDFPAQIERLEAILKELQVFNRVGLGVYPDWYNPGFHLDVRGTYARWGRIAIKQPDGKVEAEYVGYADAVEHAKRKAV